MNKRHLGFLALSAGLLGGCSMNGPNPYEVHEALLYGATQERVAWIYGSLNGGAQSEVKLGSQTLTLRPQVQNELGLPGTLSVNGVATYRQPTSAGARKVTVSRAAASTFTVLANGPVDAVYYTDGRTWYKLTGQLGAGATVQATAQANTGLRGAGKLTDAEADALGGALLHQGQLAVAVVPEGDLPDPALTFEPQPRAYMRTGLYLQGGVTVSAAQSLTTPARPATPPANAGSGTGLGAQELGRGGNSAYRSAQSGVQLSRSQQDLNAVWAAAYGNAVPTPSAPSVNFSGNSVVTFFLGQRPTGGYSVRLVSAQASGDGLMLTVQVTAPGPDTITTQALTSPWLSVQVPGIFERVTVRDTSGRVLAQTR